MPIDKNPGESKDEFISRCISTEIKAGKESDQAAAICYAKWDEFASIKLESYSDYPDSVKNNAKSVLDWTEKNGWGSCGTPVGKIRANQLANGEPISADTIQRMYSYLSRHEVDLQTSKSYSDGCGKLMYDSWGGLSAKSWAESKIKELNLGTQSVTDNTWSTEAPISIQLSKISFDYDDTLSTTKGKEMAKAAIRRGDEVYIISARNDRSGLLSIADELNIPYSRVFATGSNRAKEAKVKELGIDKHIDNNALVVRALPGVGQKFKAVRKVIFNEDFDDATVIEYIEKGFKVHIRSSRKINKKDKKVWNKLRAVGLTEDVMVFGEVKDLDKKYEYDLLMTGQDPILERLKLMGEDGSKYKVLSSRRVDSMSEAFAAETELTKDVTLKFVKVVVRYTYEEIEGIPSAKSGSRPFCSQLRSDSKMYSLEEISSLSTAHLNDMGLPDDVFTYRGGFYRNPVSKETTPFCRHYWKANVVVQP